MKRIDDGIDGATLAEQRAESALIFVVSEVADVVQPVRRRLGDEGHETPPHITLLHPFVAPHEVTPALVARMMETIVEVPMWEFEATGLALFPPDVWYLTVDPSAPFVALITKLRAAFSSVPSYWDNYNEVIPHITVTTPSDEAMPTAQAELDAMVLPHLPIQCTAREVQLYQRLRPPPAPVGPTGQLPLGVEGLIAH